MNLLPWREQANRKSNYSLFTAGIVGLSILAGIFYATFLHIKTEGKNLKQQIDINYSKSKQLHLKGNSNETTKQNSWITTIDHNNKLNHAFLNQLMLTAQVIPRYVHLSVITLQEKHITLSGQSTDSKYIYQLIKKLKTTLPQFDISLANLKQKKSRFYFHILLNKGDEK